MTHHRLTVADLEAGYMDKYNRQKTLAALRYVAEQPTPIFPWTGFAAVADADMEWVRCKGPSMGILRHTAHFTGNPDTCLIIDLGDYGAVTSQTHATLRAFFGIDTAIQRSAGRKIPANSLYESFLLPRINLSKV